MGGATKHIRRAHNRSICFNRRGDSLGGATYTRTANGRLLKCFNRRGDSLGGATGWLPPGARNLETSFNRRGDSLGGATTWSGGIMTPRPVSIAEAILWGEQPPICSRYRTASAVSIAEAILWGEQRARGERILWERGGFNRRGDSLGGATAHPLLRHKKLHVSIAEAILWGEQRQAQKANIESQIVSIAEAILWGEQHVKIMDWFVPLMEFQSQRRFFGGSNYDEFQERQQQVARVFQSQRRFFGGSNSQKF